MADHSTCTSPTCGAWADGRRRLPALRRSHAPQQGLDRPRLDPALPRPRPDGDDGHDHRRHRADHAQSRVEIEGGSFTGTAEQGRIFLGLFLLVFVFGMMSTLYGIFQIVTRRESKAFIIVTLVLAAALVGVTFFILYV